MSDLRPRRPLPIAASVAAFVVLAVACSSPSPTSSPSLSPSEAPASAEPSQSAEPSASASEPTPAPTDIVSGPATVALESVVGGFVYPTAVTNAGDGSDRLFVVERRGVIHIVEPSGQLNTTPFLDIRSIVRSEGEQGLLGLAFHPDYRENGRFFVAYTRNSDEADVIAEYHVTQPGPADPGSEIVLLAVPDPAANHNGGGLAFGPDGYLYVSMGDGGGQNDQFQNGQNLNSLLGKMLRLDVDGTPLPNRAYAIPAENPFASGGGAPEILTVGMRNPWRFSFDRATGDLYIADVGGGDWEEIDRQAPDAEGAQNYGWPIMEGAHCRGGSSCSTAGYVPPIAEYDHSLGCAVVGGYVYRGEQQPSMNGAYIFADWCSGLIFTLDVNGTTYTPRIVLRSGLAPSAFGEDEDGEMYLVDFNRGGLYRVVGP